MKSIFITAIYANLHGTDLGGRTSRTFWYRWSLLSILKTNPTKVVCFTSKAEIEDLEHWFFEEQGIKREQLEFKVYYLRKSKFFKKIQKKLLYLSPVYLACGNSVVKLLVDADVVYLSLFADKGQ